jgi:hypothetical protein
MRPTLNTYNIDVLGDFVEKIENRNKEITAMNNYCSQLEGRILELLVRMEELEELEARR